jgi:hypothetical protein
MEDKVADSVECVGSVTGFTRLIEYPLYIFIAFCFKISIVIRPI